MRDKLAGAAVLLTAEVRLKNELFGTLGRKDLCQSASVFGPGKEKTLKKGVILLLVLFAMVSSAGATTRKPRHHVPVKHSAAAAAKAAADKAAAENARDARQRVAVQIKALTHFVYLFAGIQKTMEMGDSPGTGREASTAALELNNRNKAKLRASIASMQQTLERLETDFRFTPAFKNYSPYLTGLGNIAQQAESQAAANHFDEAGRSLLKA